MGTVLHIHSAFEVCTNWGSRGFVLEPNSATGTLTAKGEIAADSIQTLGMVAAAWAYVFIVSAIWECQRISLTT